MATQYNSTDVTHSRYTQGGQTERYPTRLGWWTRRAFPKSDTDIKVTITDRSHQRPWIVSYDYYGSEQYEWLILQYNNILDVTDEFVVGTIITIPSHQRLNLEIMSGTTGGQKISDS